GVAGAERPERDERGADGGEGEVRDQAGSPQAAELHEHENRERSERGEERRLRVPDHLIREGEDARHDDRGARSGLERLDVRHRARSYDLAPEIHALAALTLARSSAQPAPPGASEKRPAKGGSATPSSTFSWVAPGQATEVLDFQGLEAL